MGGVAAKAYAHTLAKFRHPKYSGTIPFEDLDADVEIIRDKWGVPHIYAQTELECMFAQGFTHAQERFWQMEVMRRASQGRLAEVTGEDMLVADRMARTFGFYRLGKRDWETATEEDKQFVTAYVRGINAWITSTGGRKPVELELLSLPVEPWTEVDSCALMRFIGFLMAKGWTGKLISAAVQDAAADEPELLKVLTLPFTDAHLDPTHLPKGGIEVNEINWDELAAMTSGGPILASQEQGSNAWVVSGKHTTTGKPILANDPHLSVSNPSIWYQSHLIAADGSINVHGFAMPGTPYISIGHNEFIGWGITVSFADTTDLFIEKVDPNDPNKYLFKNESRDFIVHEEKIWIRDRADPHIELVKETHHGPVFSHIVKLSKSDKLLAVGGAFLEPSSRLPAMGYRMVNKATDWNGFKQGCQITEILSINAVYADVYGNIGYHMTGKVPIRSPKALEFANLPVEGWTGECEWQSFIPMAELPHCLNPEQGFIVSCNHRIVNENYPYYAHLGNGFKARFRADRIIKSIEKIIKRDKVANYDCALLHQDSQTSSYVEMMDTIHKIASQPTFYTQPLAIEAQKPNAEVSLERIQYAFRLLLGSSHNMSQSNGFNDNTPNSTTKVGNSSSKSSPFDGSPESGLPTSSATEPSSNDTRTPSAPVASPSTPQPAGGVTSPKRLAAFSGDFNADSIPAAVYTVLTDRLLRNILNGALPENSQLVDALFGCGYHARLMSPNEFDSYTTRTLSQLLLEEHTGSLLHRTGGAEQALMQAMIDSIKKLRTTVNIPTARALAMSTADEFAAYSYGSIHKLTWAHLFGSKIPSFNRGPYPCAGSADTPNMNSHYPDGNSFDVSVYPSLRMILPMADLSRGSLAIHAPGQSGHISSQHYDDLIPMYINGEYYPMLFDRDQITQPEFYSSTLILQKPIKPLLVSPKSSPATTTTTAATGATGDVAAVSTDEADSGAASEVHEPSEKQTTQRQSEEEYTSATICSPTTTATDSVN